MINTHNHSEYSFLDGYGSPEKFVLQAIELGQKAIALTEHGNVLSALPLQRACQKHNIKAIFGCEFYFTNDSQIKSNQHKNHHMIILAKNAQGFQDIQAMCTYANMKGFYRRPRIDTNLLLGIDLKNLIITTACPGSWIKEPKIDQITQRLLENHADIFVEIQPHKNAIHKEFNEYAYKYACKWDLDLVAGVDAHCPEQKDTPVQDVLMCVQMRKKITDPTTRLLPRADNENFHTYCLFDEKRFLEMDSGSIPKEEIQNAVENTDWIADNCNVKIENKKIILPLPPKLEKTGLSDEDLLWDLCLKGFKKRLKWDIEVAEEDDFYFTDKEEEQKYELYLDRLNEEFDLISSKGFCIYFLIVDDLLKWCRSENIPVGPGRGSVAGCVISYFLDISHLDPIEHGLIFARFLNEQRNDFPDIDMDFGQKDRQKVIKYITETYGEEYTGFIVTISKMKSKASIRDISRAFDIPLSEVNDFAKSVPGWEKDDEIALEEGLDSAYGRIFEAKHPNAVEFIKRARGSIRGTSVHASGIIVNKHNLSNGSQCSVIKDKGKSTKRICGTVMNDCEDMGLMKLDVLGLATLDVLHHARAISGIEWGDIPLSDEKVFESISKGDTLGAFQIEAMASTKVVKQIKPENFDEVTACLALVRPGPFESGMTDLYIERKNGAKWESMHPFYEEITKDTYSILCYQEQVMQCFVKLAGMPFSDADKIRKIIGKKRDKEAFEPYWKLFRQGCIDNKTLSESEAEAFWDGLLKWASYGFNKCLTGDTVLLRSSGNQHTKREVSIKKLYEDWNSDEPVGQKYRRQGVTILQMDDDGKIRPGQVKRVYENGIKPVFEVSLDNGMKIKGTFNHKLLTTNGYKQIIDISVCDHLMIKDNYEETKPNKDYRADKTRGKGSTYNGMGFKAREGNVGFVDGRQNNFNDAKKIVFKRSGGICEKCKCISKTKGSHAYEYAHIHTLESLGGDYSKYHSDKNLRYLCNSCHKKYDYLKGERVKRYAKGIPASTAKVIGIKKCGMEMTYDLEMDTIGHNFIANGIVSHNSHAASYALITYWCMWYKINHPEIFYCAALSFASWDEKKTDISKSRLTMMEEILIKNPDYKIMTPKYDLSEGRVWTFKNNTFYMPFDCINSVDKRADEYAKKKKKKSSMISIFDDIDVAMIEADSKQDELLVEMMCHDPEKLPTLENQKKHLPFQLPYQSKVEIENKKSVANNCQKDILKTSQGQLQLGNKNNCKKRNKRHRRKKR